MLMKMTSQFKRIIAVVICIPLLLGTTVICGCGNNYKAEKTDAQEEIDSRNGESADKDSKREKNPDNVEESVEETTEESSETTTESSNDEQKAIDEWLAFLDGWWLGEFISSTTVDGEEVTNSSPAVFCWITIVGEDRGYVYSVEKETGDLIASKQSSSIRFHKIDNDHISVGGGSGASEYSRTTEPTEEDMQTVAVIR